MKVDRYSELMAKYFSGECNQEETQILMDWVAAADQNKILFEEQKEIWTLLAPAEKIDIGYDLEGAWEKVSQGIEGKVVALPRSKEASTWSIQKYLLRISAVILLCLIAGYAWWSSQSLNEPLMVEVQTLEEEEKEIELPDGSKVWLNENTIIRYAESFNPREVTLEGEAYFDVEHLDKATFEIFSGDARTLVLGTAFNVRAYPEEDKIEVMVERGKVAVDYKKEGKKEKSIVLTAGNTGILNKTKKQLVKTKDKGTNTAAWRTQKLEFSDTQMGDVITSLERYFEVSIEVENSSILNCHFDGKYQNPEIDQIMEILKFGLDLNVEKQGTKYRLSGIGCEDFQ